MAPQLNTTLGSTITEYASSSYSTRANKRSRNDDVSDGGRRSVEPSSSRSKRHSRSKEEQKSTRSKPPLSCGECRRLKLKCDRVFPCQSCVKRGCGGICPEGSLTSGRGSRYILANTEQLHEKILQMADRIRDLEDALQSLHFEHSRCLHGPSATAPSHPLLRNKLLLIKSQLELYGIDPSRLPANPSGSHSDSSSEELTDIDVSDDGASSKLQRKNLTSTQTRIGHVPFDEDRQSSLEIDASIQGVWSSFNSIRLVHEPLDGRGVDTEPGAQVTPIQELSDVNSAHSTSTPSAPHAFRSGDIIPDELPDEIKALSASFPLAWSVGDAASNAPTENAAARIVQRIRAFLPPRDEALFLCRIVRENLLWQLNCIMSEKATISLISEIYSTMPVHLNPRKLALLLMFLVIGKNVEESWRTHRYEGDSNGSSGDHATIGGKEKAKRAGLTMKAYHQLARASLCAIPITDQPDLCTVQTLFLMTWYLLVISEDKQAGFAAWGVMGITAKLAQALGLHREASQLVGSSESQQERRLLFWELLHLDARMSLAIGRPPSFSSTYRDCKRPTCTGPNGIFPNRLEAYYYDFKFAFYEDCLAKVTEYSLCTSEPDYIALLELDRKIRDYAIPQALTREANIDELNTTKLPEHILKLHAFHAKQWKDSAILQLHRTFYSQVFSEPKSEGSSTHTYTDSPERVLESYLHWPSLLCDRYAPSVLATFVSACIIIEDLEKIYECAPDICPYYAVFWFNAFCSAVALCVITSRVPSSPLAPIALRQLVRAGDLFRAASAKSHKVARSSEILQNLVAKAMFTHKLWEASQDRSGSNLSNTTAEHRERLRALADHLHLLSQDGNQFNSGARTALQTGSTILPNIYDVWGSVHPDICQLLVKLLRMEDDQGGSSLSIGGSQDIASTDGQPYFPTQPPTVDTHQWDMLEQSGHFNMCGIQAAATSTQHPDFSLMSINFPLEALNFSSSYPSNPSNPSLADQAMSSMNAGEVWYANQSESISQQFDGYNNAYNQALADFLPSLTQSTQLNIPVDPGISQSQVGTAPHAYNDLPGSSHYHNMPDFSLGAYTSSEASSNKYQYHDHNTTVHDWGH